MRQWRPSSDATGNKLAAMLSVAMYLDGSAALWKALPDDIGDNEELILALRNVISSIRMEFSSRDGGQAPIWEWEAVESFKRADSDGNWVQLLELWPRFAAAVNPDLLQQQTVRCLARYKLGDALASIKQTAVAMLVASALSPTQRLKLGIESNNPCDRESSGEENEHEVLKPFIAIQRVQLPPGKGQPTGSEPCMAGGDARREA